MTTNLTLSVGALQNLPQCPSLGSITNLESSGFILTSSGDQIFARTISVPRKFGSGNHAWNYHSRSDHHSKVACWGIVFDLLRNSQVFRRHVEQARVVFGINHTMVDFQNDRKKDLDLVICQPAIGALKNKHTLATMAEHYAIELTAAERLELQAMPVLRSAPVGNVLIALEAKACMTAHQKALPRLYDELNSSHLTVHGAHDLVIAAGFVAINAASRFLSPERNNPYDAENLVWNVHSQPKAVAITIEKIKQLRRRSRPGTEGYDALAISVIECANDGSPVGLHTEPPAPQAGDTYHYASMIDRLRGLYETRFANL